MTDRERMPPRREGVRERFEWAPAVDDPRVQAGHARHAFHLDVGFKGGRPLELFLLSTNTTGKVGSPLHCYGEDLGIAISLLLQHGYTLDQLAARFKVGSLGNQACRAAKRLVDAVQGGVR